ncbi:MAG: hypothetical protein FWG83_02675 [Oscillospiraceae bacterium]|nr:hypothetical protein [Oscillospiraceae bacterium]
MNASKTKKGILRLTQTALLLALLVGWQALSRGLGNQYITGCGVNFILAISTLLCSFPTGLCVGAISPVLAMLFGVAPPFWILVPFISLGNIVYVAAWAILTRLFTERALMRSVAVVIAAVAKFGTLYLGVHVIIVNVIGTKLPPPVLAAFSFTQLITALIGGTLAFTTFPLLKKALRTNP